MEEKEEIVHFINNLTLVGRMLADKVVHKNAMRSVLQQTWKPKLEMNINDPEDNVFLLKFKTGRCELDFARVLDSYGQSHHSPKWFCRSLGE